MADFSSAWLLRKKQFQSLSGVTPDQFRKMVILLRPHWKRWVVGPKNRDGRPYGVGGLIEGLARRVRGVSKQIKVTAEEAQALILDCTEQPVYRPTRKQRCWYSGKTNAPTIMP